MTYIGADGAGHYVKMVHNGIEYGDMQLIAEAYSVLKNALGISNDELASVFSEWNNGELSSYLIDITKDIFRKKDEDGNYLVDVILDEAANKGTGKWTSQSALDLGVPLTLITESVFARYISFLKDQRVAASKVLKGPKAAVFSGDKAEFIEKVRRALYLGKIVSYAQGFSQLRVASDEYNWDLNYGEIAKIFRAGCIIRAQFLQKITDAYAENPHWLTCCWPLTSHRLPMNISRHCVMWSATVFSTVSRHRPSLPLSPIMTATAARYCRRT